MSFDTMVLAGANSALPHGIPGANKMKRGDFVLFDLGVIIDGYCSDITRTVAFGEISEEQTRIYNTVLAGQLQAVEACKPGVTLGAIDNAARSVIADAGYGDFFPHRLGHGLGISVHEYPDVKAGNESPLKEGMVFTIEPGIYVPNVGGVRIEDDIYITKDGSEILTKFPKELQFVIEKGSGSAAFSISYYFKFLYNHFCWITFKYLRKPYFYFIPCFNCLYASLSLKLKTICAGCSLFICCSI